MYLLHPPYLCHLLLWPCPSSWSSRCAQDHRLFTCSNSQLGIWWLNTASSVSSLFWKTQKTMVVCICKFTYHIFSVHVSHAYAGRFYHTYQSLAFHHLLAENCPQSCFKIQLSEWECLCVWYCLCGPNLRTPYLIPTYVISLKKAKIKASRSPRDKWDLGFTEIKGSPSAFSFCRWQEWQQAL